MGHIAHLRKQFKSLYHNVDSENKEKTLWEFIGSSFEQTWIPFTQGCFVPKLVEIGPVVLEKNILKFCKVYFHYFIIISPWKRSMPFISGELKTKDIFTIQE